VRVTVLLVVNDPKPPFDSDLRDDALDVLGDSVRWRLTAARWATVDSALDGMRIALSTADVDGFRAAVYAVELAGPVRARPVDNEPIVGIPATSHDVVDELISVLSDRDTSPGSV
jgi:hypothetical protein